MNPIFRKEVITSLRSNRALWLQILFVATLAGMAIILWPSEGIYSLAARSSGQLPILLALGQLALVCLFAPAFTAPSLTSEVEKNTFDMLFGTQLRPAEIAFGKMAGGLTFLLLVVLSSVPVVGLCFVLGGVTARDASLIYAILVVTALLYGLLGLTISGLARRSYQAVIATYAATLLLAVGVLVPAMMWWERAGPSGRLFVHVLESLSPFRAMVSVIRPDFARVAEGKVVTLSAEWRFFLPVALVGIVSLALVLCWLLRRPPQPPRRTIRAAVEDRPRRERIARRLFFVIDPHRRRRPIGQLANPVLIKELRSRPLGSGHRMMRVISACVVLSLLLMVAATQGTLLFSPDRVAVTLVVYQLTLVVLIAPALAAPTISGERESGVFELLRATPLSSWTIVAGKFQAALLPLLLIIAVTTAVYASVLYVESRSVSEIGAALLAWVSSWFGVETGTGREAAKLVGSIQRIGRVFLVVAAAGVFCLSCGMLFSAFARRTSVATAAAYSIVGICCLGTFVGAFLEGAWLPQGAARWFFVFNPVAAGLDAMGVDAFRRYHLYGQHLALSIVATAALFCVTMWRVGRLVRARNV